MPVAEDIVVLGENPGKIGQLGQEIIVIFHAQILPRFAREISFRAAVDGFTGEGFRESCPRE